MGTSINVVHQTQCPDTGPICAVRDEPPYLHDQQFYVSELRALVEYGLTEHVGVELQLPLRLTRTTIVYRHLDGALYEPDYPNIHHRNETLAGLGDPWLTTRLGRRFGALHVSARFGVTLPLGKTEENPFELGRAGLDHQHLQSGTGTFDPILAVEAGRSFDRIAVRAYAQAQVTILENARGFQAGNRYGAGMLVDASVVGRLRASVGADVITQEPERWRGVIEQDGNLGRTDVLVGASVTHGFGDFDVTLGVKVPVYTRIIQTGHEGGQLTYPGLVNITVRRTFDLGGESAGR